MKKIYVGKSSIQGKGIFAGEGIQKGEKIQQISGRIIKRRLKSEKESRRFANWIGLGVDMWLNPNATNFRYLNHSCDPNAAIVDKHTLVALKEIGQGDEITFDYSLTDMDPHWRMTCSCTSPQCRKVITSIYSLPRKSKYTEVFSTSFLENLYTKDESSGKPGLTSSSVLLWKGEMVATEK